MRRACIDVRVADRAPSHDAPTHRTPRTFARQVAQELSRRIASTLAVAALALVWLASMPLALAQADPAFEQRLKSLEEELRCLVCQNQTLADSNAPLAEDLRREVRALAVAGKDDTQIRQFLVERYGDFVLYKPPVKATTWLLWFGPFVLLGGGAIVWALILRRRRQTAVPDPVIDDTAVDAGVARARELLDDPRS
jgi:cytochrome c-type biogenesis protein CcmH